MDRDKRMEYTEVKQDEKECLRNRKKKHYRKISAHKPSTLQKMCMGVRWAIRKKKFRPQS